jgi:hypothetical protein
MMSDKLSVCRLQAEARPAKEGLSHALGALALARAFGLCTPSTKLKCAGRNTKPAANSLAGFATGFENFCCVSLLRQILFTPAKALPIAAPIPGATGAITAAVIASVVHDFQLPGGTIGKS